MNSFEAKCPTRVDLAGGTLDLWPLHLFVEGASTINVAIDVYTYAWLSERTDSKVILESSDLEQTVEYENIDELLADNSPDWLLLRRHVNFWKPDKGFHLKTRSESPVGGGLGGSSSLSVAITQVMSQFCNRVLEVEEMINLVSNIEAQVLKTPTGTQDYYPPLLGGMNIISYGCEGRSVEVRPIPDGLFSDCFFLVYTGRPHNSGLNNWSVLKEALEGNEKTLRHLQQLKDIAEEVRKVCELKNWDSLGPLLRDEFAARVELSPAVTSPEIQKLEEVALNAGAEAVKICGAGGGGCIMVWSPPSKIEEVKSSCQKAGYRVINARPVPPSSLK